MVGALLVLHGGGCPLGTEECCPVAPADSASDVLAPGGPAGPLPPPVPPSATCHYGSPAFLAASRYAVSSTATSATVAQPRPSATARRVSRSIVAIPQA